MAPTRPQDAHGNPFQHSSTSLMTRNNASQQGFRVEKAYRQHTLLSASASSWAEKWVNSNAQLPFLQAANGSITRAVLPNPNFSQKIERLLTSALTQMDGIQYDVQSPPARKPAASMLQSAPRPFPMPQPPSDLTNALLDMQRRPLASLPSIANHQYLLPQKPPTEHPMPLMERASANVPISGHGLQHHIPSVDQLPYGFPGGPQIPMPVLERGLSCVPIRVENVQPALERLCSGNPKPVLKSAASFYIAEDMSKPISFTIQDPGVDNASIAAPVNSQFPAVERSPPDTPVRRRQPNQAAKQLSTDTAIQVARLPFQHEHGVLCTIQQLVEAALFEFANKHFPELLREQGWETAEAGELNRWNQALKRHRFDELALHRCAISIADIDRHLKQLHMTRHSAVHRLATPIYRLEQMIRDAQTLMRDLNDICKLNKLHGMSFALAHRDDQALQDILKAPVEVFKDGHNFDKFRTKEVTSDLSLCVENGILYNQKDNVRNAHQEEEKVAPQRVVRPRRAAAPRFERNLPSQRGQLQAIDRALKLEWVMKRALESERVMIDLTDDDAPAKITIDLTED